MGADETDTRCAVQRVPLVWTAAVRECSSVSQHPSIHRSSSDDVVRRGLPRHQDRGLSTEVPERGSMSHEDDPRLFRSLWNLLRASLKTILLLALAAFYYFYPMFREPRERLLIAEKLT